MRSLLVALLPHLHVLLSVLGVLFLVAAGFAVGLIAGLITAGVACLVLAYYAESEAAR